MKRLALVIGNSMYYNCSELSNPVNDVNTMKELLKIADFEVMAYLNLDYKDMRTVIDKFGKRLGRRALRRTKGQNLQA